MAAPRENLAPWDHENTEEHLLIIETDIGRFLETNRVIIVNRLLPSQLFPHLRQLNVLDRQAEDEIRVS